MVALLAASICAVSACAPPSLRELAESAGGAVEAAAAVMSPSASDSEDSLLEFLAGAKAGEVRELDNPSTGAPIRATAGRVYHAASGRVCRRYAVGIATAAPESHEKGLACESANGSWVRAELLAPASP